MAKLLVEVLSPTKSVLKLEVKQVLVPSVLGYLGILPGHAPLLAELGIGRLELEKTSETGSQPIFFISGGYVEVLGEDLRILADVVERPEEIDRDRARRAAERAVGRLVKYDPQIDVPRAQRALRRSTARLDLIESVVNFRAGQH